VGDQLLEALPGKEAKELANLAILGDILASVRAGQSIFLLRQHGLEMVDFSSGTSQTLQPFEEAAIFGQLLSSNDGEQVYYTAAFDASCESNGYASQVGRYDQKRNQHDLILKSEQNLRLLGPTSDRKSVLVQPVGCDPSFVSLWQVSLNSGNIEREYPVQGDLFSELSPRARYFATLHHRSDSTTGLLTEVLAVYDLAAKSTLPLLVNLPKPGAHIWHMMWNSDATWLYFSLVSDLPGEAGPHTLSYGVWRANPFSGRLEKVIGGMPGGALRLTSSRHMILARLPGQAIAMQIDLLNAQTRSLKLPWPAVPGQSLSELPTSLSPDGAFLLVWHVPQGQASMTHLSSCAVGMMDIPAGAILLGWR
jgi:hypothetical protein